MFEKLLKAADKLAPSVAKSLQKAGLPAGNASLESRVNNKQNYFPIM